MTENQFRLFAILSSGVLFGLIIGIIDKNPVKGLIMGLMFGVCWGLIFTFMFLRRFNAPNKIDKNFQLENPNNEKIIYSYFANLANKPPIQGRLFLLETTLQFLPYKINRDENKTALIIPLSTIKRLESKKLYGYAPTGLEITHSDNQITKLFLMERPTWIKLINEQITKLK